MNKIEKIIFIHTPCYELENDKLEAPLGILYIATFLKINGIDCEVCDLSGVPVKKFEQTLKHFGVANIYAFSTYSVSYNITLLIKRIVAKINPRAITIAGGPHATALPDKCRKNFDIIITGEAEQTFLTIVQAINNGTKMRGVYNGEPIESLDDLPFPDYELVDLREYGRIVEGERSVSLITSRGCPYNCVFCNSRVFSRGSLRFRSPDNVVAEIMSLRNKYGVQSFRFSDDLFTFSPERVIQMTSAIKPLDIIYRIFARSCSMTPIAAKELYKSGCRHVSIGIESMSEKMLSILKKKVSVEMNINALRNCKNVGLKVRIYVLVGFPGETEQTINESLEILLDCAFDEFIVYSFIPYPGTAVWEHPERWGAKIDRKFSSYVQVGRDRRTCYAVSTDDFTANDVKNWRYKMISALEDKFSWAGNSKDNK